MKLRCIFWLVCAFKVLMLVLLMEIDLHFAFRQPRQQVTVRDQISRQWLYQDLNCITYNSTQPASEVNDFEIPEEVTTERQATPSVPVVESTQLPEVPATQNIANSTNTRAQDVDNNTSENRQELIDISQSTNIDARSKWQMKRVDNFCRRHGLDAQKNRLPRANTIDHENLMKHILYDDQRELILCFLPKVGCTNTRRFMYVLTGALSNETIHMKNVEESDLRPCAEKTSLLNPKLTSSQRLHKIVNYWKFVILRNPLERLVSAFRDKLESPLLPISHQPTVSSETFFEMHKREILKKYARQKFLDWKKANGTYNLTVDFQMYIRWVIDTPNERLNEHFSPMFHLSQPCRLRYHFYGNFKRLSSEMNLVMERYQIPTEYFYDHSKYRPNQDTSNRVKHYYSMVSPKLKAALLKDFRREMEFYYLLFPEDDGTEYGLLSLKSHTHIISNSP